MKIIITLLIVRTEAKLEKKYFHFIQAISILNHALTACKKLEYEMLNFAK